MWDSRNYYDLMLIDRMIVYIVDIMLIMIKRVRIFLVVSDKVVI